jgi:hypothetical protein
VHETVSSLAPAIHDRRTGPDQQAGGQDENAAVQRGPYGLGRNPEQIQDQADRQAYADASHNCGGAIQGRHLGRRRNDDNVERGGGERDHTRNRERDSADEQLVPSTPSMGDILRGNGPRWVRQMIWEPHRTAPLRITQACTPNVAHQTNKGYCQSEETIAVPASARVAAQTA